MEKKNAKTVCVSNVRKILALLILSFLFSILSGQESDKDTPALKDRLFYGGNIALQFGTITNIEYHRLLPMGLPQTSRCNWSKL